LFCFETIFLFLFVLTSYFNEIIINNLLDTSTVLAAYFNASFSDHIENKGILVNTIALVAFLLAATRVNENKHYIQSNDSFIINRDLSLNVSILSVVVGLYVLYLGYSGYISSWFRYTDSASNYSNSKLVNLSAFLLVLTALEFSQLSSENCSSFKDFLKKVNKVYLAEMLLVSGLLLISGNRNECLLILFPMIICYYIFIKPFNNKQFIVFLLAGITVMIVIGLTRNSGSLDSIESINLYDMTRDFCFVDNNTKYLIEYADDGGMIGFKNAFIALFSSIPYLGGLVVGAFGLTNTIRTTEITTQGMQLLDNMDSGLGTSLIGDLYCTGGFLFTLLFMYFLGWLIASLDRQFTFEKKYNIWALIIYLFMFSNVVYYIRAEWTMPFRYIGFSFTILFVLLLFQPHKKSI